MTNKLIALVGPLGSGKSTVIKQLISMGVNFLPLYTTMAPDNICFDKDIYQHIDKDDFSKLDLVVKYNYKEDYFGLIKKDVLEAINTFPITLTTVSPAGVKQLSKILKKNFESVYIMADLVTIVGRMLQNGYNNDAIKKHLEYAEKNKEFDSWKMTTHVIKNISSPTQAVNQLMTILGLSQLLSPDEFKQKIHKLT